MTATSFIDVQSTGRESVEGSGDFQPQTWHLTFTSDFSPDSPRIFPSPSPTSANLTHAGGHM